MDIENGLIKCKTDLSKAYKQATKWYVPNTVEDCTTGILAANFTETPGQREEPAEVPHKSSRISKKTGKFENHEHRPCSAIPRLRVVNKEALDTIALDQGPKPIHINEMTYKNLEGVITPKQMTSGFDDHMM